MSRIRTPSDEWSRLNDLDARITAVERTNPLQLAVIASADGSTTTWRSANASSLSVAAANASTAPTLSTSSGVYGSVGAFSWPLTFGAHVTVPVFVTAPTGGACSVRLVDNDGIGTVMAEITGIVVNGYVILTGQVNAGGTTNGQLSIVEVDIAKTSGSSNAIARLDAMATVH